MLSYCDEGMRMKDKLKGCRPSQEVMQEYSNVCTDFGAASHRAKQITLIELPKMSERMDELLQELHAAKKQEALKIVPPEAPVNPLEALK